MLQTPSVLKAFLFVVNGRLVGVVVVAFPLLKKKASGD
ncbi:putative membrane protein [Escherichia coli 3-475-03_S3_C2]|nr:putative membrane protein [Escherichia coli EPEC C342-62]EZJ29444.1 putative membrane protein [Escherichia coli 2-005-03_S4_C3]EZJ59126.1 putative membrane protein [Escherichia coli 2-005-03_S4_C2]KDT31877.1 putative membrane protein [Escherichia coli 2-052-05_S4_C1]KDT57538.1 putative membrane protein [Escherichia coli 3-267-03_S1_C3]KDU14894.1 putative membrane protein [Escherichia coli 3-267-03_S1_C1]KEK89063.1 putative membrane protein [Escherichia coli 3-475-03_S3_C2]